MVARQLFKLLERYDRSEVEVLKVSGRWCTLPADALAEQADPPIADMLGGGRLG